MNDDDCRDIVAGIDIGGTTTSAVLVDQTGAVTGRATTRTPARHGGAAMAEAAAKTVHHALEGRTYRLIAVGVGAAGVVDPHDGSIVAASDSFHGWAGFPLAHALAAQLDAPVRVANDVNAFVEGERRFGAVRGLDDVLGITLGTGVGGALVLGGELFTGPHGAAGEIGHIPGFGDLRCSCGRSGHLETLASGRSIAARYLEQSAVTGRAASGDGVSITAELVAERARLGDVVALAVMDDAGRAVGRAAVMVATLVDVAHVVVGGGVAGAWDLLEPAIKAELTAEPPVSDRPVVMRPSALHADAVAVGAAALAAPERWFHLGV